MAPERSETEVVVIGGGVIGCSIAYHLARAGCPHVTLVERRELASASTACAAGLVGQLRSSAAQVRLVRRTLEAIRELEAEGGEPAGFHAVGSVRVASTPEREREIEELVTVARAGGVEVEMVDAAEARRLLPALDTRGARAIAHVPSDGFVDPHELAMAYARAARARGVTIWTGTAASAIRVERGRVAAVETDRGEVACRIAVDAAGAWAGPVAELAGGRLPQSPVRSHFWITAPRSDVDPRQPVLRLPDAGAYLRPEVGGLLIGIHEPDSRAYDAWSLGPDFDMRQVERDWDVLVAHLPGLLEYLPALEEASMVAAMAGLTTYTPDGRYLLGRSAEVEGFLVASGCGGLGVAGSGGIGAAIAGLVTADGDLDLAPFRLDRFGPVDPRSAAFRLRCAAARSGKNVIADVRRE